MFSSRAGRLTAFGILLTVLLGLTIWYGSLEPSPDSGVYPGNDEIGDDYNRYIGQLVTVSGQVQSVHPLVIQLDDGLGETHRVTVQNADIEATIGDDLRVFGVIRDDRIIEARTAIAVPQTGLWYTYGVSGLAGLWVLGRIIQGWQFDSRDMTLRRRPSPRQLRFQFDGLNEGIRRWRD